MSNLIQISAVVRADDAYSAMEILESQLGGSISVPDSDVLSLDVARKQTETYSPGIRVEKVISNA